MSVRPLREVLERVDLSVPVDPSATYPMMGVRSFGRGAFAAADLRGADTRYPMLRRVERDLLVYPKLMAWEGAFAVVPGDLHGRFVSPEFVAFRPSSEVDPAYLAHLVAWEGFREGLIGFSAGTNARRRRLQPEQLLDFMVPLPDIVEQRRIAAHIAGIAGVGDVVRRDYRFFRSLKGRILGDVLNQKRESVRLGEILERKSGEPVSSAGRYRIAGVYSFGRGLLERATISGSETKYATLTRLDQGDVVYSKLGAFEGAVAVVDGSFAGSYVSPEFPVFASNGAVDPAFLRHQLASASFEAELASRSAGVGARQKRVSPEVFLGLSVPLPPRAVQERCNVILDKVDRLWRMTLKATQLSRALLPAARNEIFNAMR